MARHAALEPVWRSPEVGGHKVDAFVDTTGYRQRELFLDALGSGVQTKDVILRFFTSACLLAWCLQSLEQAPLQISGCGSTKG